MAKGAPNIAIGYNPGTKKPAGKPIGNSGQDLVNKIRSGGSKSWGGGKW